MSRPRLLDLFCGAGGAAMGYHRAGFEVVGVDNRPQPRYPFEFHQADAMTYPLGGFDAIHASPPCQDHSRSYKRNSHGTGWMLEATRARLQDQPRPWIIENVPGSPLRVDYKLCGCMFGLPQLKRERWFETSWRGFDLRQPCDHRGGVVVVAGHGGRKSGQLLPGAVEDWRTSMGIDWMTGPELAQAIPPEYTLFLGKTLREQCSIPAIPWA